MHCIWLPNPIARQTRHLLFDNVVEVAVGKDFLDLFLEPQVRGQVCGVNVFGLAFTASKHADLNAALTASRGRSRQNLLGPLPVVSQDGYLDGCLFDVMFGVDTSERVPSPSR